jgi:hypothetical protein
MPASVLALIAGMSWQSNHLVDANAVAQYLAVNERREVWSVVPAPGLSLTQATYQTLATSTSNADGSFTDANGARWKLDDVPTPGWASLVSA